jgi:hypothetical protein
MNLTDEQKQLLEQIATVYTSGCRSPFILIETLDGASLVYSGHPNVPVNAVKTDVMRLAAEGYVDCAINPQGDPHGKATAAGIALVQRGFADIPVLPVEPDTISASRFRNLLASDLDSEEALERLMVDLLYNPDVETYYFSAAGTMENQFIKAATDRGDILKIELEKFYYANPKAERDFFHIPKARYGDYSFDWQRELVEKGPEYIRIRLKLSERQRLELETLHRIQREHAYRERLRHERNAVDVFLSYASADQREADSIYADIIAAGGTAFLAKKSLAAGEDFAERIREALRAAEEVWLLLSPASLKSEWMLTEWGAAWVLEKSIVPILLGCRPEDLPPRLARLQCIDLSGVSELVKQRFQSGLG